MQNYTTSLSWSQTINQMHGQVDVYTCTDFNFLLSVMSHSYWKSRRSVRRRIPPCRTSEMNDLGLAMDLVLIVAHTNTVNLQLGTAYWKELQICQSRKSSQQSLSLTVSLSCSFTLLQSLPLFFFLDYKSAYGHLYQAAFGNYRGFSHRTKYLTGHNRAIPSYRKCPPI